MHSTTPSNLFDIGVTSIATSDLDLIKCKNYRFYKKSLNLIISGTKKLVKYPLLSLKRNKQTFSEVLIFFSYNSVCPEKLGMKTILKNDEKIAGNLEILFPYTFSHTSARVYTVTLHLRNSVHNV